MKNLYSIFLLSVSNAFIFYSLAPHGLFLCGLLPFFDMPYTYQRELMSEYGYYIAFPVSYTHLTLPTTAYV